MTYRLTVLTLSIAMLSLAAAGQSQQPCRPPTLSAAAQGPNIFTTEQESDLGDAIAEHIQRNFKIIEDDEVTAYLRRVGERIIKHLPPAEFRYLLFLVDIPEVNAFALPGERVYVSRKLVAFAQTEGELAGVIAHELGHLLARHSAISMTRLLREVLGVTEVQGRGDIFEKYNRLVENAARKPGAFGKRRERARPVDALRNGIAGEARPAHLLKPGDAHAL